jgi:probable F420-dependent oxidoreductase
MMEFGIHLPTYWSDYGTKGMSGTLIEAAKAAQDLGYSSLWTNDTVIVTPEDAWAGHVIEPLVTLAWLSSQVLQVQLGISVLVLPQRNAIIVAKEVSTLYNLCQRRLILGVGTGWREAEFRFLNADFDRRGAKMDESIEVLRTLWESENPQFHGEFYEIEDALFHPRPDGSHIPIWIGGNSSVAIRRAARAGDGWLPVGIQPDALKEGVDTLSKLSKEQNVPTIACLMMIRMDTPDQPAGFQEAGEALPPHIVGPPEEVIPILQIYQEAGLEHLICDFQAQDLDGMLAQMRAFAVDVIPYFKQDGKIIYL